MTIGDINNKISALTRMDTNGYTSENRLIDINIWVHKVQSMIFTSMDEYDFDDYNYTDYPNLTTPLVAGQRDYTIPNTEKVVSIKRVDISYDGVNYYRATPIDTGEMYQGLGPSSATAQQTKTDSNFDKTNPRYDVAYNSVFIYPAPVAADVTNGGKIFVEWSRELKEFTATDLTNGTAVPGFDTEFHPILAYGPAYEFLQSTGQQNEAAFVEKSLKDLEARLIATFGKKQLDRDLSVVPLLYNFK
jgi:hypothetical protein